MQAPPSAPFKTGVEIYYKGLELFPERDHKIDNKKIRITQLPYNFDKPVLILI